MEGGTAINYEIRYMLILLAAVVNQNPVQKARRAVRWENILKLSDFHNITNIIYLGSLGIEKDISEDCRLQFYQSYKRELLLRESYHKAEEVIRWQLERYRIDALVLTSAGTAEMYDKPEMAHTEQIEFLVESKHLPQIHRFMRDMNYEQQEDRLGKGTVYIRVPGIRVVFYNTVPVENRVVKRYFSGSVRKYQHMDDYRYIHTLSREEEYLYRAGRLVESYVTGVLKIREILDFWQFQRILNETFRQKIPAEVAAKAGWEEFIHQTGVLAALWFEDGVRQEYGLALELEEYIVVRGQENKRLDEALLPQERARLDFYWRDREGEWEAKKREWLFPPREYMFRFFPILGKYPFLLVFCWLIRYLRIVKTVCLNKCRRAWVSVRVRLLDAEERFMNFLLIIEKEDTEDNIHIINNEETEGEKDVKEVENQK